MRASQLSSDSSAHRLAELVSLIGVTTCRQALPRLRLQRPAACQSAPQRTGAAGAPSRWIGGHDPEDSAHLARAVAAVHSGRCLCSPRPTPPRPPIATLQDS